MLGGCGRWVLALINLSGWWLPMPKSMESIGGSWDKQRAYRGQGWSSSSLAKEIG